MVPLHQLPAATGAALEELVAMHEASRASVKLQLREAAAEALRANQSEDLDVFIRLGRVVRRAVLGSGWQGWPLLATAGRPRLELPSRFAQYGALWAAECRVARGPLGPRSVALESPQCVAQCVRNRCVWPSRLVQQPRVQEQLGRYIEGLGEK